MSFLKNRSSPNEKPFFAAVGFSETHRPFNREHYVPVDPDEVEVPQYLPDNTATRLDLSQFCGSVNFLDRYIGTLLTALDQTDQSGNTIVVFTVDHGIAFPRAKSTLYDPGLETALIIRWPNRWRGLQVHDSLLSNVDLLPTLLRAIRSPISGRIQGRSFLGLLDNDDYVPRQWIFAEKDWHDSYDPIRCLRTTRYKLIRNYEERPRLIFPIDIQSSITSQYLSSEYLKHRPPLEFYDLEDDPYEKNNVAGKKEYRSIQENLCGELANFMIETQDPLLKGASPRPYPHWWSSNSGR
jgi:arylsulfatase A-like enzyme